MSSSSSSTASSSEASSSSSAPPPPKKDKKKDKKDKKDEKDKKASKESGGAKGNTPAGERDYAYDESGELLSHEEIGKLNPEMQMYTHVIPLEELCELNAGPNQDYRTNTETGLTSSEAAKRLEENGPNMLTPPEAVPEWKKFIANMTGWFSILLWVGSILSFIGYAIDTSGRENLYIGIVLAVVVFVTGVFSYYQERKSDKIMEGFKKFLPAKCNVLRDGNLKNVEADTLVLGDIVEIKGGDRVPADLRLIRVAGLKVENSSLTGEPEPQPRAPFCTDYNPMETKNMAFYSTLCIEGKATGVVVNCGDDTVIGRIKDMVANEEAAEVPIHREIDRFIIIISSIAIFLGITFFIVSVARKTPVISSLVFMIGIIVANVPEGLLATVTVSLSLTAQRMAQKNVLVKHLEAVETLGSTTTICSDKTGTLTQNKMTVVHMFYGGNLNSDQTTVTAKTWEADDVDFRRLNMVGTLCNNAAFLQDGLDQVNKDFSIKEKEDRDDYLARNENLDYVKAVRELGTTGDASESALIKFCHRIRNIYEYRDANPMVKDIPFNSKNKWQLSIHLLEKELRKEFGVDHMLVFKGAPERVISFCDKTVVDGEEVDLDDDYRALYEEAQSECASRGERILGFAYCPLDKDEYPKGFDFVVDEEGRNFPMEGFVFCGFFSLFDPPRAAVPGAVDKCQRAGIKVIMVTGDHPATAKAIAQKVNIIESETAEDICLRLKAPRVTLEMEDMAKAVVVRGVEIPELEPADWDRILSKPEVVFARTSPQQKLIIVSQCQERGAIVAVTGDGVNDSPALKKANIGVAMGIMGSDVAKDAADMILLDDNFASIVNGVEEGRLIFDNLKKSIAYTLSSNIPEISPFLIYISVNIPLPLSTVLILCIDLGTDMLPAISLAYEKAESDIMNRPPRKPTDNLVTSRLISFSYFQIGVFQALAGFYVYMVVLADQGFLPWMLPNQGIYWSRGDLAESRLVAGAGFIQRDEALRRAQTAYFISIVIVQWADLVICKTRKLSLFQQGMWNKVLNLGLFEETALCCFMAYVPGVTVVLGSRHVRSVWWLAPMPFSLAILIYDELRKMLIRSFPGSFIDEKTYY